MILLPRREPFASEIIRKLTQRGVPVAGADRIRLKNEIAVMDLMALGRFVLLPEDDLNLAALLRSPLVGLGEEELFALGQSAHRRLVARTDRAERRAARVRCSRTRSSPTFWRVRILRRRMNFSPRRSARMACAQRCSRGWARGERRDRRIPLAGAGI